jgi:hypothetical protein
MSAAVGCKAVDKGKGGEEGESGMTSSVVIVTSAFTAALVVAEGVMAGCCWAESALRLMGDRGSGSRGDAGSSLICGACLMGSAAKDAHNTQHANTQSEKGGERGCSDIDCMKPNGCERAEAGYEAEGRAANQTHTKLAQNRGTKPIERGEAEREARQTTKSKGCKRGIII